MHGFDEFYGNLYHLNAEEEPEQPDYPKELPIFQQMFMPRGVLDCKATDVDDPTEDPRFGRVGKQTIRDTGPLTRKRMETIEDDLLEHSLDFIDRAHAADEPFLLWHNTTRMHVWTHLSERWKDKTGLGVYADGMQELDWVVGELLGKLDELGIADNTDRGLRQRQRLPRSSPGRTAAPRRSAARRAWAGRAASASPFADPLARQDPGRAGAERHLLAGGRRADGHGRRRACRTSRSSCWRATRPATSTSGCTSTATTSCRT